MTTTRKPTHPGAFLKRMILVERGITITDASKRLGITRKALSEFLNEHSKCTPSMAKRLSIATGTGVSVWIMMQANLDIWVAENLDIKTNVEPFEISQKEAIK